MILFSMDLGDTLGVRFGFPLHKVPWVIILSPFPSYGDLPRFGILEMSGSS